MNDTDLEVVAEVRERYRALASGERVRMASSMFETAKALAIAGIRAARPGISDVELRVAVFERFYGRDVPDADRAAVIARIRAGH